MTTGAIRERYRIDAPAYERAWAPVLRAFSRPLLDALEIRPGERALDAGCGTGALAAEIRERTGRAGFVAGLDLTVEMLVLARAGDLARVAGDLVALPFRDASFDLAVSTFVLHHLRAQEEALREARRVLAPSGRVGIAVWGRGDMDSAAYLAWSDLLDRFGAPEDLDPPRSYETQHETPKKAARLLERAGFARVHAWSEAHEYAEDRERFEAHVTRMGALARRLRALEDPRRAAFLEEAARLLNGLGPAAFLWRGEIVYAIGHARASSRGQDAPLPA